MTHQSSDEVAAARQHLDTALRVHEVGDGAYVGECPPETFDRVYGGQVAAQALLAAAETVAGVKKPISNHVTYLRRGVASVGVEYQVRPLADGRTLTSRTVEARQGDRLLAVAVTSFQDPKTEHTTIDYSPTPPRPPSPAQLISRDVALRAKFGQDLTPQMLISSWPFEARYIDRQPWDEPPSEPANRLWIKSRVEMASDETTQAAALLYATDLYMCEPVLMPGPIPWESVTGRGDAYAATLDFSMWFHRGLHVSNWLLQEHQAPACANSRGLTTGRFWDCAGELVASFAQLVHVSVA